MSDIFEYAKNGDLDNLKLELAKGVNVNIQDERGLTALMLAAGYGNANCVNLLINENSDFKILDRTGFTALFYADYHGHKNCVKLLEKAGAIK